MRINWCHRRQAGPGDLSRALLPPPSLQMLAVKRDARRVVTDPQRPASFQSGSAAGGEGARRDGKAPEARRFPDVNSPFNYCHRPLPRNGRAKITENGRLKPASVWEPSHLSGVHLCERALLFVFALASKQPAVARISPRNWYPSLLTNPWPRAWGLRVLVYACVTL